MQPVQRMTDYSPSHGDRTYHAEIIDIPVHARLNHELKSKKKMLKDEEVLFAWSIASVELDDKTGTILLKMIVELWLTI